MCIRDRSCVVAPLLHTYVNGAVPPVTVRSIDPVEVPLQWAFTCVSVNTMAAGSVITIPFRVCVHPPASVTVTLYVPAGILVRSWVVAPLLHTYVNGAVPPVTVRSIDPIAVSYTHLRAHVTGRKIVCGLVFGKK